MEKNLKHKRRSQLAVAVILIIALLGILIVNTDRVAADREKVSLKSNQVVNDEQVREKEIPGFLSTTMPSLFKLGSALAIVIICIYLGLYFLRKLMGKKYSSNNPHNLLEVLETTYIAPKKSVTLLRVADKSVLIGMSENHVSVLTELNSDKTSEILAGISSEKETDNFKKFLKTASQKLKKIGVKKTDKTVFET